MQHKVHHRRNRALPLKQHRLSDPKRLILLQNPILLTTTLRRPRHLPLIALQLANPLPNLAIDLPNPLNGPTTAYDLCHLELQPFDGLDLLVV